MRKITHITGRVYDTAHFTDTSRHISGAVTSVAFNNTDVAIADAVMHSYDDGTYYY